MLHVMQLGLGEIGKGTIDALLAQSRHVKLVSVVDPVFAGKTMGELMPGRPAIARLKIVGSIHEALKHGRAEVASMTTGSRTEDVRETAEELISARVHVVTTCEELSYPKLRASRVAAELDRKAKQRGIVILGTGVNPGFAMDAFALACTAPCSVVRHIRVVRSLDASKRRQQLQKKVGAGMSVAEVKALIRKNMIGHVGLGESCAMLAEGLGWKLQAIREKFEPIVADHAVRSEYYKVEPGQVRGMRMTADGIVKTKTGGKKLIELDLTMAFDADTFDEVIVDGDPPLLVRTKSGFPGEACTVGMVANCLRVCPTLTPGVRTMMDVFKARSVGA